MCAVHCGTVQVKPTLLHQVKTVVYGTSSRFHASRCGHNNNKEYCSSSTTNYSNYMKFAEFNVFVLGIQDQLELVSGKEQHLVLCFRVYYVL